MTILSEKVLKEDLRIRLYESPYATSNSFQREKWINEDNSFFERNIFTFWEIYSSPFSEIDRVYLSKEEEANEKMEFIKSPIFLALDGKKTVGGIWIQKISKKKKNNYEKEGLMHIKVLREKRSIANPLMEYALMDLKNNYKSIYVKWGARSLEDEPSSFLKRYGFQIEKKNGKGFAFKRL